MKLHLGCGSKYLPGWVHIDVDAYPHVQIQHEISNLPMLTDGSADEIYACHVLEHYMRRDVRRVLTEWFRLLRSGGVLRVAVPDFGAVAQHYKEHGDLTALHGLLFGNQGSLYNVHYAVYDEKSLTVVLESVGFIHIQRFDWKTTDHASIDDFSQAHLPHMDKTNGLLMSLNIEAIKP
jgi:predicted SAM-dependent methyltransferase